MRDKVGRLVKRGTVVLRIIESHRGHEIDVCFVAELKQFTPQDWEVVLLGVHKKIEVIYRGHGSKVTSELGVTIYKIANSITEYEDQRL